MYVLESSYSWRSNNIVGKRISCINITNRPTQNNRLFCNNLTYIQLHVIVSSITYNDIDETLTRQCYPSMLWCIKRTKHTLKSLINFAVALGVVVVFVANLATLSGRACDAVADDICSISTHLQEAIGQRFHATAFHERYNGKITFSISDKMYRQSWISQTWAWVV